MNKMLNVMKEIPITPEVYRTWNRRIFLKVVDLGQTVVGIGMDKSHAIGILPIKREEFHLFYKRMDHVSVGHTIQKWLEFRKYIPISPKLEEVIMAVMAFDKKYRPVGKFASVEDATAVCPENGIVVNSDGELEGLTIGELTAIYNNLVKGNIKKFENKAIATKRTGEAMDAYKNPEPRTEAKSKPKPKEKKMPTGRDKMREFLTEGKIFTIEDIATLLETNKANASTGVNLLKTRPSKGFQPLVTEKTEDGKLKVVQAPCEIKEETGEKAEGE